MYTGKNVLPAVDFEGIAGLNKKLDEFFLDKGIAVSIKPTAVDRINPDEKSTDIVDSDCLRYFAFQTNNLVFYLNINKIEDIKKWESEIQKALNELIVNSNDYLAKNPSFFEANMLKKFQYFIRNMIKCRQRFKNFTKKISGDLKECNSIEEVRQQVVKAVASILKDGFFNPIVEPLYMGMSDNPQNVYRWLIKEINRFLSVLGIETIVLHAGDVMDFDQYEPTEDSAKNITHDEMLKNRVRKIIYYAYAFKEHDKIYPIMPGKASVWVYRKG